MNGIDWKRLFISFDGRIARRTFWIGFALVMLASILANLIPVAGQILSLVLLWPQLAIHAKRLHDMGYSGWLQLIPLVITVTCLVLAIGTALFDESLTVVYSFIGAMFVVGLGFLFWVGLTRGETSPNRFGPQADM